MKEKQLKHDLDEQVRYPVPVHLLSTNKTVCFRRQQQKPASRRYNRAGHIWTQHTHTHTHTSVTHER